jgi:rhamnosyltransferase
MAEAIEKNRKGDLEPKKVSAVIVLYNHNEESLIQLINSIRSQVSNIFIIYNGHGKYRSCLQDNAKEIFLERNVGIAAAQNIGTTLALEDGAEYILYSDQDSIFPAHYVSTLLNLVRSQKATRPVAAIGPAYKDKNKKNAIQPAVNFGKFGLKKTAHFGSLFHASHIISSGSLIEKRAFFDVGPFKNDFFIDWVDTEWCWRAAIKGYDILQTDAACLDHAIGESKKPRLMKVASVHNNLRDYYKIRNAVHMIVAMPELEVKLKFHLFSVTVKNIILFCLKNVLNKNFSEFYYVYNAIFDGFTGRLGEYRQI